MGYAKMYTMVSQAPAWTRAGAVIRVGEEPSKASGLTQAEERGERWRSWMIAAQGGDAEAYHSLLSSLLPYLRAAVRSKLGDDPALEDVVQEVLIRVHTARHTYQPTRPLLPWVRTIARNASVDALRRRARQNAREQALESDEFPAHPAPPSSVLSNAMVQALDHLPAPQREAVVLLKLEGLSVQEAARKAGITPGALKLRAHRGYRALRQLLEGEGP